MSVCFGVKGWRMGLASSSELAELALQESDGASRIPFVMGSTPQVESNACGVEMMMRMEMMMKNLIVMTVMTLIMIMTLMTLIMMMTLIMKKKVISAGATRVMRQ